MRLKEAGIDGLEKILVSANLQSFGLVFNLNGNARNKNDGRTGKRTDLAAYLVAVGIGQEGVQENQIRLKLPDQFETLLGSV